MKNYQLLTILLLTTIFSYGQGNSGGILKELESINTIDQAKQYLNDRGKDITGGLYSFNSNDSSQMAKDILVSEIGDISVYQQINDIGKSTATEDLQMLLGKGVFKQTGG
jgi:hypothetical protein